MIVMVLLWHSNKWIAYNELSVDASTPLAGGCGPFATFSVSAFRLL